MPMILDINIKNQETMNSASFNDYDHFTSISKLTSWMLNLIGLLHENIQYEMLQSQYDNSGQQASSHTSSAMLYNEYTQLSSKAALYSNYETCQKKYSSVISWPP